MVFHQLHHQKHKTNQHLGEVQVPTDHVKHQMFHVQQLGVQQGEFPIHHHLYLKSRLHKEGVPEELHEQILNQLHHVHLQQMQRSLQ